MSGTNKSFSVEALQVRVFPNQDELARDVAGEVQHYLQETLQAKGEAAVILATGNSQIQFLNALVELGGVDWSKITCFHMDEYLGISDQHPASFRRYLRERVEKRVHPKAFHYLEGDTLLPLKECDRYARLLNAQPIDLCCLGIGENGHLAFNDPPVADFEDPYTVKLVKLDRACQQQQVDEGHFPDLASVPEYAFTLTIPTLCSARKMVCIAPESRKAKAVKAALKGEPTTSCPASILCRQAHATLWLDHDSVALL